MNYDMIGGDGKQYGPVPETVLLEWAKQGRINALTQVRQEGSQEWKAFGRCPEFMGFTAKSNATGAPAAIPKPVATTGTPANSPTPANPAAAATPVLDTQLPAPPSFQGATQTHPLATWSMVLGILAMVICGIFTGIPAIICGHKARREIAQSGGGYSGDGQALAGLILGYLSTIFFILVIGLFILLFLLSMSRSGAGCNLPIP